ncbi:MAG TPA: preprotein translocase subunit SecE [Thermoleophilaceae bacterium]
MARNRQQAKQRQAERRAKRLAGQGDGDGQKRHEAPLGDPTSVEPSPAVPPELAVGAPPTDEGRSDRVFHSEPTIRDEEPVPDAVMSEREALAEIEDWEIGEDEKTGGEAFAPRVRRGSDETAADRKRPRVVQFLIAVWAELQRVQWPDRQALTTLTGVVLGFVLIAGGYLGLLDAIVSRIVNAIL